MKPIVLIGVVLLLLGAIGLITGGITYKTERESVDFGPIQATVKEEKKIPIPPIVGGLVMAAGAALVVMGRKSQ
ncbi:MAG: DUF3185 domain-containing protein [Terriglobales bacterium]